MTTRYEHLRSFLDIDDTKQDNEIVKEQLVQIKGKKCIVILGKIIIPVLVANHLKLKINEREAKQIKIQNNLQDIYGYLFLVNSQSEITMDAPAIDDGIKLILKSIIIAENIFYFHEEKSNIERDFQLIRDFSELSNLNHNPSEKYRFNSDYLIIDENKLSEIEPYLDNCELWGGFSLKEPSQSYKANISELSIPNNNFRFPSLQHEKNLLGAIESNHAFYQFLRLYHQFELLFKVGRLHGLKATLDSLNYDETDYLELSNQISSIAENNELNLLKYLITKSVDKLTNKDFELLMEQFKNNFSDSDIVNVAKKLFQENPIQNENPLKESTVWDEFIKYITNQNNSCKASLTKNWSEFESDNKYKEAWLKLLSWWIYRIRCSIAHNKFGETIFDIGDQQNEKFVIEFGIPMIKILLMSLFTDNDFMGLFPNRSNP